MTTLIERTREALKSQDPIAIAAVGADLARAVLAADELVREIELIEIELPHEAAAKLDAYRAIVEGS